MFKASVPVKGLIFDWDGTLIDTESVICQSVQQACESLGYPVVDQGRIRAGVGLGPEKVYQHLFHGVDNIDYDLFRKTYRSFYLQNKVTLYPKVYESLMNLHQHGFKLAIATNKRTVTFEPEFENSKLSEFISFWACADMAISKPKPEPDMLLCAADAINLSLDEIIMVGDTVYDAAAAQTAGCRMYGLLWGAGSREELLPVSHALFDDITTLEASVINDYSGHG